MNNNIFKNAKLIRQKGEPWQNAIQRAKHLNIQYGGKLEDSNQKQSNRNQQNNRSQQNNRNQQNNQQQTNKYWIEEDEEDNSYDEIYS